MDEANPKISVEYTENATVATLMYKRILDESEIEALENTVIPLIEQAGRINLVVDFSNVEFLSSAVLGLLIRISKKVYESSGQLKLCGINSQILKVFKIKRLERVFDIHKDRDKALESLE